MFDNMFDNFSYEITKKTEPVKGFMAADCFEEDGKMTYKVDLPSVKKDEISINLTDGYIVVEVNKESDKETRKGLMVMHERDHTLMRRFFKIPTYLTPDDVKASLNDGVLTIIVNLPKTESKAKITID